jgi:hypothetical protein
MSRGPAEPRPTGDEALAAHPFDWRVTADRRVLVSRGGRQIVVVGGARGRRLADQLDTGEAPAAQQLLARATGNYRHGNERR